MNESVRIIRSRLHVTDPAPGLIAIAGSVGAGGVNRREDTRGVQTALNAVLPVLSGPDPLLAVDGLVGPLTIGAIKVFQTRWLSVVDGRVDPGGPTIRMLNRMPGVGDAVPEAAAPRLMHTSQVAARKGGGGQPRLSADQIAAIQAATLRYQVVNHHHMQETYRWVMAAVRVTSAASRHVQRLRDLGTSPLPTAEQASPDRVAFLLIAKHFLLHEKRLGQATKALAKIDSVYRRSLLVLRDRLPRQPGDLPAPPPQVRGLLFVCLFLVPKGLADADAYTTSGGLQLPGPSGDWIPGQVPGKWVAERRDAIYLTPTFDTNSGNMQRAILIHELAHFTGPTDFRPHPIDDPAYVYEELKYQALTAARRLDNADTWSVLALELGIGTARALTEEQTSSNTVPLFPRITADFVQVPKFAMPPAGDPAAAGLAFPGGFR